MASTIKQPEGSFFKEKRVFAKRMPNGFPVGKRTELRITHNIQLHKLGIHRCEVMIGTRCTKTRFLTWAHSKKSRFLVTSKDWMEAARCCLPCHEVIEAMSHEKMAKIVRDAIARRKT